MDKKFKVDMDWEEKAKVNPLFAIMSDKKFEDADTELTDNNMDFFFQKGSRLWHHYFAGELWKFGRPAETKILEFGCGMGRILKCPGELGYQCYGVDISETQLKLAQTYLIGDNYNFQRTHNGELPFSDREFDYVYSFAVLQHILKLSDFEKAVKELCRVVKKDGTLKLQLPTIEGNRFCEGRRKFLYSWPFETRAIVFYFTKKIKFLPMLRLVPYNHWGGASYYYRIDQLINILKRGRIQIDTIAHSTSGYVVVTGIKL